MNTSYPLIELPKSTDLALFLIREELKSRRLFNNLAEAGFDYSPFRPHLDEAILKATGLPTEDDKSFDWYTEVMNTHSQHLTPDRNCGTKQALEVYLILYHRARHPEHSEGSPYP